MCLLVMLLFKKAAHILEYHKSKGLTTKARGESTSCTCKERLMAMGQYKPFIFKNSYNILHAK